MAVVRLFAQAREAAGTASDLIEAPTVAELLDEAVRRWGPEFAAVLSTSKVWVNGEEVPLTTHLGDKDEVAVLPPVSGGS